MFEYKSARVILQMWLLISLSNHKELFGLSGVTHILIQRGQIYRPVDDTADGA